MSDTGQIKDKIDIVDFIGEYVQLKPAGINHKGLCPFHNEKSPSFMVNRDRQNWHCFGCSKGGDIFSFLQEIEGMEFVEALKMLADRAGVPLTFSNTNKEQSSQKTRIKDINAAAASFFHNFLIKLDASKKAREYLEERGLTAEIIEEWQIGFVPEQWDLLTQYLLKKGFAIDDLVASGLTIKKDNANRFSNKGFYDRFRGRIMFPIWDVHGSVVGFTGRILVETEKSGGKYVNTPQTIVYDKSRVVFGLNKAKQEIKNQNLIVMVEGQMDVIASHQAGMKNVVATSGTALTEMQIKLLKRYSNNINMAFDADQAGESAAKRGIDLALAEGMNIKVIQIPEDSGKDPDDCIKNDKEVWFGVVKNAKNIMDWYLEKAFRGKDISDPKQKQQIANEVLPEIGRIPYAVEKDHWLRELSSRLAVDVDILREDLSRIVAESGKGKVENEMRNAESSSKDLEESSKRSIEKKTRLGLLLEELFALVVLSPNHIQYLISNIQVEWLSTSKLAPLYKAILDQYNTYKSLDIDKLRSEFNEENKENLVDILLMKAELDFSDISESDAKNQIESLLIQIVEESKKQRRQEIKTKIEIAEKAGDTDKLASLIEEFKQLN